MDEITLSIMVRGVDTAAVVQRLLEPFQQKHHVQVNLRLLNWESAWSELVKVALYNYGPDVSEIGTTWVGNLIAMNGLRPYSRSEIAAMGGANAFLSSAWHSATLIGDSEVWAMPWLADSRVMYYRRDIFRRAGINTEDAFRSAQNFDRALARVQAAGFHRPWAAATHQTLNTLHNIATWVWGAGGEFVSLDGRRILFTRPEALAGMCAYFELRRYLIATDQDLNAEQTDELFRQGKSAATLSGPWMIERTRDSGVEEVRSNLGAALPPGPPFVGGSNLVVWKHCRKSNLATDLVQWLTSQTVQAEYTQHVGLFPVKLDTLALHDSGEALHKVVIDSLKQGRSFPSISAWGLLEDGLSAALAHVWADLLADPKLDTEAVVKQHILSIADRIENILVA